MLNGQPYDTPSAAAMAITGNPVNGWTFRECRLPGLANWQIIEAYAVGLYCTLVSSTRGPSGTLSTTK